MIYQLHIGANNTSGIVETDKILKVLNENFDGYTLQDSVGYWKGKPEKSCVASIANVGERSSVVDCARKLAQILDQDAVGISEIPTTMDFITPVSA